MEEDQIQYTDTLDSQSRPIDLDDNAKTSEFIENLSTGNAKLGLPPAAKQQLNSYLINIRKKYADAARKAGMLPSGSSGHQKYVNEMNNVNSAIQTLADQVDSFKANQLEYIKDFDNDALSNVDKVNGKANVISKLYRGDLEMNINNDGTINFGEEGKFVPYSAIANHSIKQYKLADNILKLTNDMYKTATPLSPERKALIMNQVNALVSKGGKDAIISLVTDNLIPGFENINVSPELYKTENYPKLQKLFLEKIGHGIEAAAKAGYEDKLNAEELKHTRSLAYHQQQLQQNYDFRQTHPSLTSRTTAYKMPTSTSKGAVNKKSPDEIFAAAQGMPGEEITVYGVPFTVSNKKDKLGNYGLMAKGNNRVISKESFVNWANKHK